MSLRVLTVCAGNICRSPSAAAAILRAAEEAGIEVGDLIVSIEDPSNPELLYQWRIEDPELRTEITEMLEQAGLVEGRLELLGDVEVAGSIVGLVENVKILLLQANAAEAVAAIGAGLTGDKVLRATAVARVDAVGAAVTVLAAIAAGAARVARIKATRGSRLKSLLFIVGVSP